MHVMVVRVAISQLIIDLYQNNNLFSVLAFIVMKYYYFMAVVSVQHVGQIYEIAFMKKDWSWFLFNKVLINIYKTLKWRNFQLLLKILFVLFFLFFSYTLVNFKA